MTPLPEVPAFPAPPEVFRGDGRAAFGSRTVPEILAIWALLAGAKTTTEQARTVRAIKVQRDRLGMGFWSWSEHQN